MLQLSSLPFSLTLLLSALSDVLAAPSPTAAAGLSVNLLRRSNLPRSPMDLELWAKSHRDMAMSKYGAAESVKKRASGTNLLTNQAADSSFFGSLAIGTPPISYNVILDTGSADLWVASSECKTGCFSVPTFNPSASSTFQNSSTPFSITYGSGGAAGALGNDKVQMAGFSVDNQIFAVCDRVSSGLLNDPVSGLLGLAWSTLAASRATPLWQTLVAAGAWDQPVMSFQLTRFVNDPSADELEAGGTFTMGFLNTSLYTGTIDYQPLATGPSFWLLPLTTINVQGQTITLPSGPSSYAAIDTGTTLVGGPPAAIAQIFSQIPGAQPGVGNLEGYYTYPCSPNVQISLSFGGQTWTVDPSDFQLGQVSTTRCLGAFFTLNTGSSAPPWIIGDTFLKNVYSVFQYQPPAVGFAQLSDLAKSMNGVNGLVPTPTIGSAAATVSATGGRRGRPNKERRSWDVPISFSAVAFLALMGASLI